MKKRHRCIPGRIGNAIRHATGYNEEPSFGTYRNEIAGSLNVAADLPSFGGRRQSIDPEWLISRKTDVLLVADPPPGAYGAGVTDDGAVFNHRRAVMEHPVFVDSAAVAHGRVCSLSEEPFGTPRFPVERGVFVYTEA